MTAVRGVLLPHMATICYADDTVVGVRGSELEEVLRRAEVATELLISRIQVLGLTVAVSKADAMVFGQPGWRIPRHTVLSVDGEPVQLKANIKYLGLVLDRKWDFHEHFVRRGPKLMKTASALSRLLPNDGGPKGTCRKLRRCSEEHGIIRDARLGGQAVGEEQEEFNNECLPVDHDELVKMDF